MLGLVLKNKKVRVFRFGLWIEYGLLVGGIALFKFEG